MVPRVWTALLHQELPQTLRVGSVWRSRHFFLVLHIIMSILFSPALYNGGWRNLSHSLSFSPWHPLGESSLESWSLHDCGQGGASSSHHRGNLYEDDLQMPVFSYLSPSILSHFFIFCSIGGCAFCTCWQGSHVDLRVCSGFFGFFCTVFAFNLLLGWRKEIWEILCIKVPWLSLVNLLKSWPLLLVRSC